MQVLPHSFDLVNIGFGNVLMTGVIFVCLHSTYEYSTLLFWCRIIVFSVLLTNIFQMKFEEKKCFILHIVAKYECFIASTLYPNEIQSKLDQINTDLSAASSIRTFLIINIGRDTKYNAFLPLVQRTIDRLKMILAAVIYRFDRLQEFKNCFDDDCDTDELLHWIGCV